MVSVYTIDGEVTLDVSQFQVATQKMKEEFSRLHTTFNSFRDKSNDSNFWNGALMQTNELNEQVIWLKQNITDIGKAFNNTQGINTLKTEVKSLREELNALKEQVNQIGATANEQATQVGNSLTNVVTKTKTNVSGIADAISQVTDGIVSLMSKEEFSNYVLEQQESTIGRINAQWRETQALVEANTTFLKEMEGTSNTIATYFIREMELLESNLTLIENQVVAEEELNGAISQGLSVLSERIAQEERELAELDMCMEAWSEINALGEENRSIITSTINAQREVFAILEETVGAEDLLVGANEKLMEVLTNEVRLESEKLDVIAEENALLNEQTGIREKNASVNKLDQFGNLPRRIGSMALTMWGFNEIMDIYEKTQSNINARGSFKYFGNQLATDKRYLDATKQSTVGVRTEIYKLDQHLNDLQKTYRKIDMRQVGANAEETAYKYNLQADKIGDLTEVMAIYGSEFVKQGRTQEDSILAVNDALDGELRRLKEVGIDKEDLEAHGWTGDQATMIDALRQIAEERGFDVTAQAITNLSDAITVLEIKIAQDLATAFEKLQPILTEVGKDFIVVIEGLEWLFGTVNDAWNDFTTEMDKMFGVRTMQQWGGNLLKFGGWAITLAIIFGILYKVVSKLGGVFDIFKKTSDVGKTTGGTVGKDMGGGFKDGFRGATKNVGKMAKIFLEFAIAMGMAFVLIEEAIGLISVIGATYDALKPQFESGIEFIKEYGIWILAIGGAMSVALYFLSKVEVGENAYGQMAKSALLVAEGLALAMGLIAEAIFLLNAPLLAIASIGWVRETFDSQITDGFETIKMMGDLLSQITLPVALFIGGLLVASVILGYAPALAIGLGIGIAISIGLVAEAILALNLPLMAIASLGWMSNTLGQGNIEQGCEVIKQVGEVLQVLGEAIPSLLVVDVAMLGHSLMTLATRFLNGGRDGLTQFTEEVIPNLKQFVDNLNATALPSEVDQDVIDSITNLAVQIPPLFNAVSKVNQALGTSNLGGNIFGAIGGGLSGAIGMGLSSKLNQLYNDCVDIMDFATKMGGLSSSGAKINSAIVQVASAIVSLKAKLDLMATTISSSSEKIRSSATNLGKAIIDGWKTGSSNFGATVVQTLTNGVQAVQNRYNTMKSGGQSLGNKLVEGWNAHSPKLKTTIANEIYYALKELDSAKSKFYQRGQALGSELHRGFESEGGLNVGSPAKIARTIAKEMEYSAMALEKGKLMMYSGGVALGQALATGYGAYGGIKTDISTLARNGLNTDELTQGAKKLAPNTKTGNKEINMPIINIDMSNSTIIGIDDFETRIRESVDKAMVTWHSEDGALGY